MNLELSKDTSKPGETVSISVDTPRNSFVSILGVDQGIVKMDDSNDLSNSEVIKNLNSLIPSLLSSELPAIDVLRSLNAFVLQPENDCRVELQEILKTIPKTLIYQSTIPDYDEEISYDFDDDEPSKVTKVEEEVEVSDEDFESRLRQFFPDVWIYDDFIADGSQRVFKVPDSITTWKISGFSLHPEQGIAIAAPKSLEVTQDYFLMVNVPHNVRVNEVVILSLSVHGKPFNNARVKLEESNDFEFVQEVTPQGSIDYSYKKKPFQADSTFSKSNDVQKILIRILKAGEIKLNFELEVGNTVKDKIQWSLFAVSDKVMQEKNVQFLVDLRNQSSQNEVVQVLLPPGTELIKSEVVMSGNLLGNSLENLSEL